VTGASQKFPETCRIAASNHRPRRSQDGINALNSGASMFMADFEDSNTLTWPNLISGQPT
jgi:hypothetical protein